MNWSQALILFLFVGLPVISRGLQSLNDKKNADRERKRREGSVSEVSAQSTMDQSRRTPQPQRQQNVPADMHLPGTRPTEDTRRAELARRRAAQLAAWRARQAGIEEAPVEMRVGGSSVVTPAIGQPGDLLSSQTGSQLLRSMLAQAEQHAQRLQGKPPKQPTLVEHQRRKHAPGSDSDTTVHRLVLSDEELAIKQGRQIKKRPSRPDGVRLAQNRTAGILKISRSPEALRQAFILKELFDPPLALRPDQY